MMELVQGEGGVVALDADYVARVAAFCREKDILVIVDEVQTGVGRTGKFLACEHFDLHPDIVTLAKGLGGGLPIGPSDLGPDEIPCPPPGGKPTRGLTAEEIAEDKELYFKAAERAKAAGFDGIEVHCAHGYYLESFVRRDRNRRDAQS